jgi:hypothetical protein
MAHPKRRVGRPYVDGQEPSVPVQVSLSSKRLEELRVEARTQRMTLSDWLRRLLARRD